ncbi:3486_t:CDS:2, partial [Gigaspora margarita]
MGQPSNTLSSSSNFNDNNHNQINSSSPNIYEQDVTTNFSPPCFDTYELDDANALLSDFSYEHNIENVSSFYPNAYEHYDNANISLPGPYEYDSAMSTYINIQDTLTELDDNEHKDNEHKDNEHEDSEHKDSENEEKGKNYLL